MTLTILFIIWTDALVVKRESSIPQKEVSLSLHGVSLYNVEVAAGQAGKATSGFKVTRWIGTEVPFEDQRWMTFYAKDFHRLSGREHFMLLELEFRGLEEDGDIRVRHLTSKAYVGWP